MKVNIKKTLFFIICLMCINIASSLQVSTISTANVFVEEKSYYDITLFNNDIYDLYDIDINADYIYFNKTSLASGENKTFTFYILLDKSGTFNEEIVVSGYRKYKCSDLDSSETVLSITSQGVYEDLNICPGDKIKFINYFNPYAKLTIFNTPVSDKILNQNDSYSHIFNANGTYLYDIFPLLGSGVVDVQYSDILIHNSNDDASFSININSLYNPTNVTATLDNDNYVMNYNEIKNNFITLRNTGNSTAHNIFLEGKWLINFDDNNFSLSQGESKAVNFNIAPIIFESGLTNITHQINLSISGNFNKITKEISVFINYKDISDEDIASWWEDKLEFCNNFPSSPFCITDPIIKYVDKPMYDCPAVLANLSSTEVREYSQSILRLEEVMNANANKEQISDSSISSNISALNNNTDNMSDKLDKTLASVTDTKILFYILVLLLFIGAIIFILIFLLIKFTKEKRIRKIEYG